MKRRKGGRELNRHEEITDWIFRLDGIGRGLGGKGGKKRHKGTSGASELISVV